MKMNKKVISPIVAIHCMVYNHEPYLRQCLDGFVMQQTDFPFVAIVHDDASTDHSAEIIREYAAKYPNIIHPIYETENQYSKPNAIFRIMFEASKEAKYIAFCEGDDYWTDEKKLQRQVDFLESHLSYAAIAENGLIHNEVNNTEYPFNTKSSHDLTTKEVIITRRFPTAGVLCRREALSDYTTTCRLGVDTIMWCWLLTKGLFRFEAVISSVYRRGEQGMTVYTEPYVFAKKIERWNKEILRVFDVQKDFMFLHIAKIYKSFIMPSIKRHYYSSAVKCCVKGGVYVLKSIWEKVIHSKS